MSTILIVDDDVQLQSSLPALLPGVSAITVAATGSDALKSVASQPPSLIFLDVRLPDVDGVELAQQFRFISKLESVPIVFLTGYVDSHVTEAARWMNHTALLKKPPRQSDVDRAIELALSNSGGRGARRSTVTAWTAAAPAIALGGLAPAACGTARCDYEQSEGGATADVGLVVGAAPARNQVSLGALVDDACHDARSALFVVSEFADHAARGLDDSDDAELHQALRVIQERTTELRVLVELLNIARRVGDGRPSPRHDPMALHEQLDEIIADCQKLARRKLCAVRVSLDCPDSAVDCDPDELRVLLTSLFGHLLSVARSSSTISWRVSATRGAAASTLQFVLRACLPDEHLEANAENHGQLPTRAYTHDAPRCALASAIVDRNRGTIAFSRLRQQLSVTVTLPRQDNAVHDSDLHRPVHVSPDPRD